MTIQILAAFIIYFSILLGIGFLSYRKQTSAADFIVGNRSLNFWLTALSAHASDMSAWLFMAFPAAVFIGGVSQAWIALGLMAGMFLNWQFVARKLRSMTEQYNSYTLSTFFEKRFNDTSGVIRIVTAVMAIVFLTSYISAGLIGMGMLFESVFGINYYIGLSLATVVIVAYTFMGGFVTVAWTDLFQALFLLFVIIAVPFIAVFEMGEGFSSIIATVEKKGLSMNLIPDFSFEYLLATLFLILGWGLGYFGQPHIVTKFMGIKNVKELTKSKYIGMTWQILALTAAGSIGFIGAAFFKDGLSNPELVFIEMVKILIHPIPAGFILCAILAATMSTMDSQILVCASVLSEDFYKHLVHKEASQKDLLTVSRIGVFLAALVGLLIAFTKNSSVLDTVLYAWSGLGCAFGPLVLVSLYSKKANKYGAMAGILVGGFVAGIWPTVNHWFTIYPVPSMIPGFFLSLISIFVVSAIAETTCRACSKRA